MTLLLCAALSVRCAANIKKNDVRSQCPRQQSIARDRPLRIATKYRPEWLRPICPDIWCDMRILGTLPPESSTVVFKGCLFPNLASEIDGPHGLTVGQPETSWSLPYIASALIEQEMLRDTNSGENVRALDREPNSRMQLQFSTRTRTTPKAIIRGGISRRSGIRVKARMYHGMAKAVCS
jgi:hypothetical protein